MQAGKKKKKKKKERTSDLINVDDRMLLGSKFMEGEVVAALRQTLGFDLTLTT